MFFSTAPSQKHLKVVPCVSQETLYNHFFFFGGGGEGGRYYGGGFLPTYSIMDFLENPQALRLVLLQNPMVFLFSSDTQGLFASTPQKQQKMYIYINQQWHHSSNNMQQLLLLQDNIHVHLTSESNPWNFTTFL